jgi:asparagine synthase (glutamine-hydrolysing)
MAGHETVAVSISGGLDSLAVLIEATRIAAEDGQRVIAVVAELTDDARVSNVPVVRRLVAAAGLDEIELHTVGAAELPEEQPTWRPQGPDLDALPLTNRRLAELACERGATVMLGGNGADETLGAVRYLMASYAGTARWTAARSYWSDSIGTHREARLAEGLAIAARSLPRRWRAFVYFAMEWPELCTQGDAPDVVEEDLRGHVSAWSATWIKTLVRFHATHHRTWAQAAAWDAVFPLTVLAGPGPIPWRHPFLTQQFIAAVQRLPIARRYDPRLPHAYWRQKAQVLALLPDDMRNVLPTAKQTFRTELAQRYAAEKTPAACLIENGIVSRTQWKAAHDPLIVGRVNALEGWAQEAVARGYSITRESRELTGKS